jgi:hypothetical protein
VTPATETAEAAEDGAGETEGGEPSAVEETVPLAEQPAEQPLQPQATDVYQQRTEQPAAAASQATAAVAAPAETIVAEAPLEDEAPEAVADVVERTPVAAEDETPGL